MIKEQLFLKYAWAQILFQVDPDMEARATAEKRDLQCFLLVSDVPVSSLKLRWLVGRCMLSIHSMSWSSQHSLCCWCQRCCRGSQWHAWQRPPPCGCSECQNTSQRSPNPYWRPRSNESCWAQANFPCPVQCGGIIKHRQHANLTCNHTEVLPIGKFWVFVQWVLRVGVSQRIVGVDEHKAFDLFPLRLGLSPTCPQSAGMVGYSPQWSDCPGGHESAQLSHTGGKYRWSQRGKEQRSERPPLDYIEPWSTNRRQSSSH